ncbi:MAG: alpha/beta fold hydrolase [Caldilineaceae bacterium]|nr:alpha/beta fold hydrolase [Caldilineaceae bacterium]
MATFVLVHGGTDGGWAWQGVAQILQSAGHTVYRPTLTGSGERIHLASPTVDLATHLADIVNMIRYENLTDIILAGLSYGGYVITGVAEQIPERIGQLVFLDALTPEDGESLNDIMGSDYMAWAEEQAQVSGEGWRIPPFPPDADRRTAMLIKPGSQPLAVNNPVAARLPRTFVHFTAKADDDPLKPIMEWLADRAKAKGWGYQELAVSHYPILTQPEKVAYLLLRLIP